MRGKFCLFLSKSKREERFDSTPLKLKKRGKLLPFPLKVQKRGEI